LSGLRTSFFPQKSTTASEEDLLDLARTTVKALGTRTLSETMYGGEVRYCIRHACVRIRTCRYMLSHATIDTTAIKKSVRCQISGWEYSYRTAAAVENSDCPGSNVNRGRPVTDGRAADFALSIERQAPASGVLLHLPGHVQGYS
jgi:hypothetical protein